MIKYVFYLFLFGLCNCGNGPNLDSTKKEEPKQLVNDSIIYELLNFIVGSKSEFMNGSCNIVADGSDRIVEFLTNDSILISSTEGFFSKEDVQFIKDQMKSANTFKMNQIYLPGKQLLPQVLLTLQNDPNRFLEFWENFRDTYNAQGYCTVAVPFFSIDKSIAIIGIGYHCGGLCGTGGIYIYKKEKGEWKLQEILEQWIS